MQTADQERPPRQHMEDLVPRPDPTVLTTEQLFRALANLRELMEANLQGVAARIDSMDKASELLHANLERVVRPLDLEGLRELLVARIAEVVAVTSEKFVRIETQLLARDTAITAAMAAAEKAVAENNRSFAAATTKSELNTGDALKGLDAQFKTEIRAINEKVSSLGSRQDKNDGSNATLLAVAAAAVAMMSLLIAAYSAFHIGNTPPPQPVAVPAPVTVPR